MIEKGLLCKCQINNRLDKAINEFDVQMKITKNIPFNKNQVIVSKDTFDTMK